MSAGTPMSLAPAGIGSFCRKIRKEIDQKSILSEFHYKDLDFGKPWKCILPLLCCYKGSKRTLCLAPLRILYGDEYGRSQKGCNNGWCQDARCWFSWSCLAQAAHGSPASLRQRRSASLLMSHPETRGSSCFILGDCEKEDSKLLRFARLLISVRTFRAIHCIGLLSCCCSHRGSGKEFQSCLRHWWMALLLRGVVEGKKSHQKLK